MVSAPVFAGFSGGPGVILGLFACYVLGTAWFMLVYARTNGDIEKIDCAKSIFEVLYSLLDITNMR